MVYKGFTIERTEGTHIGYRLEGARSIGKQLGFDTHRKGVFWYVSDPDGRHVKVTDTLRDAKRYVDEY